MSMLSTLALNRPSWSVLSLVLYLPLLASFRATQAPTPREKVPTDCIGKKVSHVQWPNAPNASVRDYFYIRCIEPLGSNTDTNPIDEDSYKVVMTIPSPGTEVEATEHIGVIVTPVGPGLRPQLAQVVSWMWILGIGMGMLTLVLGWVWSKYSDLDKRLEARG